MSITIGPSGLTEFRVSIATSTVAGRDYFIPSLSRVTLRALLQLSADRAVTARDHFVPGLNATLDFRVSVIGNASRHFHHLRIAALFQEHNLGEFFAFFFLRRLFRMFVDELRVIVAFVPLRDLLLFLFDFFWTQIGFARANGHGLHRHGHDIFHLVGLDVRGTN